MENPQSINNFSNALFEFKNSYLWEFLTSNSLKFLIGSLIIVASIFWTAFLTTTLSMIKLLFVTTRDTPNNTPKSSKIKKARIVSVKKIFTHQPMNHPQPVKNQIALLLFIGLCSLGWQVPMLAATTATDRFPIYVKANADGKQDGSSWHNAYHSLHNALENYQEGDEIWVATGTYFPENPSRWTDEVKRTFYIDKDVAIYGGFDGTEISRDERDPARNVTILSGDIAQNDIIDDFDTNKNDNVINVLYITADISTKTIIDGFTISGGYADIADEVFTNKRGGGIFSFGPTQISNCLFTQNYTIWHGGGIYFWTAAAEGGKVYQCTFEKNKCLEFGAGLVVSGLANEGILVDNCRFSQNEAKGGAGFYGFNAAGFVKLCAFSDNRSTNLGGGAYLLSRSKDLERKTTFTSCVFDNNIANNGGAFAAAIDGNEHQVELRTTMFTNNQSEQFNSEFLPNGGAINVEFFGNNPIDNQVIINDCYIADNTTTGDGAGIFVGNFSGSNNQVVVKKTQIFNNTADTQVGGMWVIEAGNTTTDVQILDTHFKGNLAPVAAGFALTKVDDTPAVSSRKVELINCIFEEHATNDPASVVLGTYNSEFTLTNCTVANNNTPSIGNLVINPALMGTINLQNTILQNDVFPNIAEEDVFIDGQLVGRITAGQINSLGANLISDAALSATLRDNDQAGTDPLFEAGSVELSPNSPAIDAGVIPQNLAETDFAGNDRVQGGCIDIGALESVYDSGNSCLITTPIDEILVNKGNLTVYPNPAHDWVQLSIPDDWQGPLTIRLVNTLGQIVQTTQLEKTAYDTTIELALAALPKGIYRLLVDDGQALVVQEFVKQ